LSAPASAPDFGSGGSRRIWRLGLLALLALAALVVLQPPWGRRLQAAWFDGFQVLWPRTPQSDQVAIVAIDEKGLAALGQWPWPRNLLADLVRRVAEHEPLVIGLDVLLPEPDRLSPQRLLERAALEDSVLAARLAAMPTSDQILARAIAAAPVVMAVAGSETPQGGPLHVAPIIVSGGQGEPAASALIHYPAALCNLDELDGVAAGHGMISADPTNAIYRRFPLVFDVNGTLAPALALDMLRVALKRPALQLHLRGADVRGVSVGGAELPTEHDAAVRLYYARAGGMRQVSAVDLLARKVNPAALQGRLVVIGISGAGLGDEYRSTPLGQAMTGGEIHAQLIENLLDRSYLRRPAWAPALEWTVFMALGLWLIRVTPRWRARHSALLVVGGMLVAGTAAFVAFRATGLLFDATPGLYLLLLYGVLLVLTLTEAARRRRALESAMRAQREREAFITGELAAAQRIQLGMLPAVAVLAGESRIDLAATMSAAREVGGDLYDFFLLDATRLYFMVGDVSGKGLPASMFMAVSKALCKSVVLRDPGASIGAMMRAANAEIGRDNAQQLFVTALIGVLDLDSGELSYCNAGHEDPYLMRTDPPALIRLADGDGPPLCAVDDFEYAGAVHRLRPGEMLCLVSDGVPEARNPAGELFGMARLDAALTGLQQAGAGAQALVDGLQAEVTAFAQGAEPADDLTVLALRWRGPAGAAPGS
jgi:adenylate cyclase